MPRTALGVVLRGDYEQGWLSHFGLKCSSWTTINQATSSRSPCSSIGNTDFKSVRDANCLGSRSFGWIMGNSLYLKTSKNCDCVSLVWPHLQFWHPRTVLLMMVAICLNACILLEQPAQSFFEYYPRFRHLLQMIMRHGGPGAVSWRNQDHMCSQGTITVVCNHSM